MSVYQFEQSIPDIHDSCFVAPSADVIGLVKMKENSSIWFNAVARGDNDLITIGKNSNVQDNAVLHTDPGIPLIINANVTVGHSVTLHGCEIGEYSLIGIGSVILNRAVIGESCLVGANTLVAEGKHFADRSLILGTPGKVIRQLTDQEVDDLKKIADIYVAKVERYKTLRKLA